MLEIKRILCPIDFSEFSIRAYRHALSLAEHYRSKVVAQHVVEIWRHPSASFATSAGLYEEFCETVRARGEEQLREFVKTTATMKFSRNWWWPKAWLRTSILSFAQAQKADLIVMGTHGRRGYDRLMLGSVTDRVMRQGSLSGAGGMSDAD